MEVSNSSSRSVTESILEKIQNVEAHDEEVVEHNEGGWLVSYADLMTLLFGFFVLMYSQSNHFDSVQNSLADQFSKPAPVAQNTDHSKQIAELQAELSAARAQIEQNRAQSPTVAAADFNPSLKSESPTTKIQAELAEAKKLINQQQKDLRLASIEPCRLCVTWSMLEDTEIAKALGAPNARGLVITDVKSGGPAERAGVRVGDIVVKVNNKSVQSFAETEKSFQGLPVNASVPLVVLREGKETTLYPSLDYLSQEEVRKYEAEETVAPPQEIIGGLSVQTLTMAARLKNYIPSSVQGVLVAQVKKGSAAERAVIPPGSVIQFVDGHRIESVEQASNLLKLNRTVHILLISHRNSKRFVTLN